MAGRAVDTINALYGRELRSPRRFLLLRWFLPRRLRAKLNVRRRKQEMLRLIGERNRLVDKGKIAMIVAGFIATALFAASIYYFNILTRYEQDVLKEQAKIEALLQRRRNITINLARTVRDYAVHERGIINHVSNMRATSKQGPLSPGAPGETSKAAAAATAGATAGGTQGGIGALLSLLDGPGLDESVLEEKLAGIKAVAEAYPDLKLSENFRRFMEAINETEKDLSDRRMAYSDVVNAYTTRLKTFPGNLFARAYGFEPVDYFGADREAMAFRPVDY